MPVLIASTTQLEAIEGSGWLWSVTVIARQTQGQDQRVLLWLECRATRESPLRTATPPRTRRGPRHRATVRNAELAKSRTAPQKSELMNHVVRFKLIARQKYRLVPTSVDSTIAS